MEHRSLALIVILFLALATFTAFWQVRNHDFVNLDDDVYVTANRHVRAGLTREGVTWAFTSTHAGFWIPLTYLSFMLDSQLYGMNPGGGHFTNLLLHIANTLLLFLVLKRMTRALWHSAFVAALFALHPLHVESVAWVTERKDVLSTFFWMLTMGVYVRYTERPELSRYLLALLFFALGLMAKPMLVTLPFVLLLIDYWPLERLRFAQSGGKRTQHCVSPGHRRSFTFPLIWEKVPFFALSSGASILTFLAHQHSGGMVSLELLPAKTRIANALVSYVSYIGKTIWPHHLAVFYPHPGMFPTWQIAGAGLLLVCISILVIRAAQTRPYLVVGWLWYIGTLLPVIGLLQVGLQSMADRFTYVPLIGLFLIIAYGIPDLMKRWRYRIIALMISAGVVLSAFMLSTWFQVRYWHNTITLLEHTLEITANNDLAHTNLASFLAQQGKFHDAIAHCSEALRINPVNARAHNNMGVALAGLWRLDGAIGHYAEALRIKPNFAEAYNNLGNALARQSKFYKAIGHYDQALRINPNYADAYNNLANALAGLGKFDEAIDHYAQALRINPDYAAAQYNLKAALRKLGKQSSVSNAVTEP